MRFVCYIMTVSVCNDEDDDDGDDSGVAAEAAGV